MSDVSELMEETINRVRHGSLDPRFANPIGFLASVHMKAIAEALTETLRDKAGEDTGLIHQPLFERMRKGLAVSPEVEAYMKQEPYPLYPELRREDAAVAPEPLLAPRGTETPHNDPLLPIKVEVIKIEVD